MLKGPILLLFDWLFRNGADAIDVLISFFAVGVMIFVVFPIHECAHGFTAKLLGDDTAERQGRLTLNPFAHIDPLGAFMMLLVPIGWAKPVPVNVSRCHKVKAKSAMALTAAAGPLSNIIMAYIFIIIYKLLPASLYFSNTAMSYLPMAFLMILQLNVYIAVFNLFPIPPLDGSKILFFFLFLKTKWMYRIMQYQNIINLVFMVMIFIPDSPVRRMIQFLSDYIIRGLNLLSGFLR